MAGLAFSVLSVIKMNVRSQLFHHLITVAGAALALCACATIAEPNNAIPARSISEALPGGEGSVKSRPFASFQLPAANLPESQRPLFHAGKALANQPWIKAPTVTDARDGLGPIYNARTCLGCHINGGRGSVPQSDNEAIFTAIVRLSVPGDKDAVRGSQPDPRYGDQLQGQSVALSHQLRGKIPRKNPVTNPEPPPEARIYLDWLEKTFTYTDGESVTLRSPMLRLEELGYGPVDPSALFSLRAAPAIAGMGLLEAIDQTTINALSDPKDSDADGISGRVNQVWDFEQGATVPGRFGWKANRSNLRITTASAFHGDLGISNPIFPGQPCTALQPRCQRTTNGNDANGFELPEHLLALTVGFVRNIGVPSSRQPTAQSELGRTHFFDAGCAACHQPSYITEVRSGDLAHLGGQTIWPYTNLLLHDMGPSLADERPDYDASGSEWRTPPLWGIGLSAKVNGIATLLHDGRARNVEEAILWHGGEGAKARMAFTAMDKRDREALIAFVESL